MTSTPTFYYFASPNGHAVAILLEELREVYGDKVPVPEIVVVTDGEREKDERGVKSDWFIKINPNGRMPALDHNGIVIFETSAINEYLAQVYDTDHKLSFDPQTQLKEWSEQKSWTYFAHGGVGPMFGQFGHFYTAPEDIDYAKTRYREEVKRLLGVLELHLSRTGFEYLAGNRYGLADIKAFPFVKLTVPNSVVKAIVGEELFDYAQYPHVLQWAERIAARPAVQRGVKY